MGLPTAIGDPPGRVVCNFPCGAASAVATKLAIHKYGEVEIIYCNTGSEHADNTRFIADCARWFGQPITQLRSAKFASIYEVFEKRKFLVSPQGAPCTGELKKVPGYAFHQFGDVEIFGYTAAERHRVERWKKEHFTRVIECPLIDHLLTKDDCFAMLARVGIELPEMYKMGFRNNNCIGCVKARDSIDYWKRVRKYFPRQFKKTAELERRFNFAINRVQKDGQKRAVFLDEIEPGDPVGRDPNIQCGLFCATELDQLEDNNATN